MLKKVVEIKPKRPRSEGNQPTLASSDAPATNRKPDHGRLKQNEQPLSGPKKVEEQPLCGPEKVDEQCPSSGSHEAEAKPKVDDNSGGGLLGLAYASSDDDDE